MQDTKSESTSNDETVSSAEDFVMDVEYTLQERLRDVQDKQEDISVEEPDENSSDLFWSPPITENQGESLAVHGGEDVKGGEFLELPHGRDIIKLKFAYPLPNVDILPALKREAFSSILRNKYEYQEEYDAPSISRTTFWYTTTFQKNNIKTTVLTDKSVKMLFLSGLSGSIFLLIMSYIIGNTTLGITLASVGLFILIVNIFIHTKSLDTWYSELKDKIQKRYFPT